MNFLRKKGGARRFPLFIPLFLVMCLAGYGAGISFASTTYYVDTQKGSDSNSGATPAEAFKTLTYSLQTAVFGDTVTALPGIYSMASNGETFPLVITAGIVLIARDGAGVTTILHDGNNPSSKPMIEIRLNSAGNHDTTLIEGFTIDGDSKPNNVNGILISNYGVTAGVSPTIRRCVITNYRAQPTLDFDASGILINAYNTSGGSLVTAKLDANTIKNSDNAIYVLAVSAGIGPFAEDHSRIFNNLIFDNNYGIALVTSGPAPGTSACRISTVVYNNTITDNACHGIDFLNGDSTTLPEIRVTVENNIISFNQGYGIYEDYPNSHPKLVDYNDFFFNDKGVYYDQTPPTSIQDITALNGLPEAGTGNNFDSNPEFVDRVNHDFHIRSFSRCVDKADATYVPLTDMDGDTRPWPAAGSSDVGADEYTNEPYLLRGCVGQILPLVDPPLSLIFPMTPSSATVVARGFISGGMDPETNILGDTSRPLCFYTIWGQTGITIVLTKDAPNETVRIYFK